MKGFRVYDKEVGMYVTDELYWLVDSDGALKSLEDGDLISYPHCVEEYDTGLTDKNGKKIFEGDIVKLQGGGGLLCFNSREYVGVIKHKNGGNTRETLCQFYVHAYDDPHNEARFIPNTIEVIGNIHDNPELLKENDNE